jgi:hypothetical protein
MEPSIRHLLKVANARYNVPWRQRLGKISWERFRVLQAELMDRLGKAKRTSICVDIWTKRGFSKSHMGLTSNFYDYKSHRPIRVLLGLRPMPDGHKVVDVRKVDRLEARFTKFVQ